MLRGELKKAVFGIAAMVVGALALFVAAPHAVAGEPPNQNDPCASGGRNTCGTTGNGFYERYKFGIRWFGDYRNAVPGIGKTFCIDLRYWYPAAIHKYKERQIQNLRNRDGERVSTSKQRKMAYALWAYGSSNNNVQQAAVMLYVHAMMGDDQPGEVDPRELSNPRITTLYNRIRSDADRYAGPYRLVTKLPQKQTVGRRSSGSVRVLSSSGRAVPNVRLRIASSGVEGVPATIRTNGAGIARIAFTPTASGDMSLKVSTGSIASTLPRFFVPTTRAGARNGQRLAKAATQRLATTVKRTVAPARVKVTTRARPRNILATAANRDSVSITGVPASWRQRVDIRLYGPFRSRKEISCEGTPEWSSGFTAKRGTQRAPLNRMTRPGLYTYQLTVPSTDDVIGTTTECGVPAETIRVQAQPQVTTVVSSDRITQGGELFDTLQVTGLAGENAIVKLDLFGPFATREAISCEGEPLWSGTVPVTGDGEYQSETVNLSVGGYYTYRERIDAFGFVRRQQAPCAETSETTIVVGEPKITTKVSRQRVRPGDTVTDEVIVSGLGALEAEVEVELWGPYPSRAAINCVGSPAHTETFTAAGDGTHTTKTVKLNQAGYYTYRERILGQRYTQATETACGEVAETTFVQARPRVTTVVSRQAIRPGSRIFDRVRVKGLGSTPATVALELFGPFSTRDAIRCTANKRVWRGLVKVNGDGTTRSPSVKLSKAGFYSYRERLIGTSVVQGTTPRCAAASETSLARPLILTGRGDPKTKNRNEQVSHAGPRPTRVSVGGLNIAAPVLTRGIDTKLGAFDAPVNIQRLGWWKDGATPGDRTGTALIAGHVDNARRGAGAFFRLRNADRSDRVEVRMSDGKTKIYRVTSVRTYVKERLPAGLFTKRGKHRLVLVTCGGPFLRSQGVYRDNVVVTAVPV